MTAREGNYPDQQSVAELVSFVNDTSKSDSQILRWIERLPVSADAKALLADLLKLTTRVGNALVRMGRKVLDFVLLLLKQFPHLGFATLLALVIGSILAMVPVLGTLAPLAVALGVTWGTVVELGSNDLDARVREFANHFSGLSA